MAKMQIYQNDENLRAMKAELAALIKGGRTDLLDNKKTPSMSAFVRLLFHFYIKYKHLAQGE